LKIQIQTELSLHGSMLLGTHTVDGHAQPTDRSIEQSLGNSNHLGSHMCVFLFIFSHHFNFDDFCRLLGAIFL
jgi:hypothetical protein